MSTAQNHSGQKLSIIGWGLPVCVVDSSPTVELLNSTCDIKLIMRIIGSSFDENNAGDIYKHNKIIIGSLNGWMY